MISITMVIDIMSNIHQIYNVIENHFYTGENIIKLLGFYFFFLEGVVGFNFYNSTDQILSQNICMQIYETTFFLQNGTMLIIFKKMLKENCIKVHFVL